MRQSVKGRWGWEVLGWESSRHKLPVRAWPPMGRGWQMVPLTFSVDFHASVFSCGWRGFFVGCFSFFSPKFALEAAHFPFLCADPGGFSVTYSVGLEWLGALGNV